MAANAKRKRTRGTQKDRVIPLSNQQPKKHEGGSERQTKQPAFAVCVCRALIWHERPVLGRFQLSAIWLPLFFLTFRPDPTPRVMDRSCVTHVGAIFAPIHRCEIDSQRLIAARNQSAAFHRHELQGQLALALAARV